VCDLPFGTAKIIGSFFCASTEAQLNASSSNFFVLALSKAAFISNPTRRISEIMNKRSIRTSKAPIDP